MSCSSLSRRADFDRFLRAKYINGDSYSTRQTGSPSKPLLRSKSITCSASSGQG
ncbi:hypothetical protein [Streptomyces sp. NPDC001139]